MFFIGIFGLGNRSNKISDVKFKCTGCLNDKFSLLEVYRSFDFFFIPVFKFKKEYLIVCKKCRSMYKLKNEAIDQVLKNGIVNYEDIERILFEAHICSNCGTNITGDYSFCPNCGISLKK